MRGVTEAVFVLLLLGVVLCAGKGKVTGEAVVVQIVNRTQTL
jgi:hypothetical protein